MFSCLGLLLYKNIYTLAQYVQGICYLGMGQGLHTYYQDRPSLGLVSATVMVVFLSVLNPCMLALY